MHRKIACLLALALTVSSLSACSKASGGNSDDLRVERDGGDYKHEYGEETETSPVITTETSDDPTTTTTESSADTTPSSSKDTSSTDKTPSRSGDFYDFCFVMSNSLGDNLNEVTNLVDSRSYSDIEEVYTGDYTDSKWVMYYCDIPVGKVSFDTCSVSYNTDDNKVFELDFSMEVSESEAKEINEYIVSQISAVYGEPAQTTSDASFDLTYFVLDNDTAVSVNAFYADSTNLVYLIFTQAY